MPRMTNTFMLGGKDDPREILARARTASTPRASAAARWTSPAASSSSAAPRPTDREWQLGAPIKGATLIGDGPTVLTKVAAIGNDMALDEGRRRLRQGRAVGARRASGSRPC
jgi:TldD protein